MASGDYSETTSYLSQQTDLSPLARMAVSQAGGFGVDAIFGTIAGVSSSQVIGDAQVTRNISQYKGGPHGQTKLPYGDGLESHHLPADSINGIPRNKGPAIQMDPLDHRGTSSHGPGLESAQYRAEVQDLITQGRMRDAMAMEIRDVRRAAQSVSGDRTKYNPAVQQMLEYAKQQGYVPPKR